FSCRWDSITRTPASGKRMGPRSEGRGLQISLTMDASRGCLDELCSATSGSAEINLAVAESTVIKDSNVHILKSTVSGPLGHGLLALLLGRSSASKMGIFVLPGYIDADYTDNIGIMVKCFLPPVTIPFGSRIAQLIPFCSCVPNISQDTRKNNGFGSTGALLVAFCQV
uniref:dUTPase-like domain-containing protein n=1 Tax=Malurus cyaneus samueli TaxID=2593467 RepID=A0A8C5TEU4_9PASS